MTKELIERSHKRHEFVDAGLIVTTLALFVSLVVAATAVSIGIARADTLDGIAGSGRLAFAAFLGAVIAGIGGLTAVMVRDRPVPRRHD